MSRGPLGALVVFVTAVGFMGCGSGEGGATVAPPDPSQDSRVAAQPKGKMKPNVQSPSRNTSLVP